MKKYIIPILALVFVFDAHAAVKVKNKTAERYLETYSETKGDDVDINEQEAIATLENDIRILDEEIAKCKKQKKGWIAATVVGAAGTVATGVAAGVQAVKLKDTKEDYNQKSNELKEKKSELQGAKKELDKKQNEKQ